MNPGRARKPRGGRPGPAGHSFPGPTMKAPLDSWLRFLAEHLRGKGLAPVLAYDDVRLGNLLVLSVPTSHGLCELDVRRTGRGAVLILLAESPTALAVLGDALGPLHRTVRRL